MENSHSASPWQTLILQSFLSLYQISAKNTTSRDYFQGYDFVFEFSEVEKNKNKTQYLVKRFLAQ